MSILFINDLPECLQAANVILYADDAIIYFNHKSINTIEETLDAELNNIKNFFKDNELIINLKKKGKTASVCCLVRQGSAIRMTFAFNSMTNM